MVASEFSTISSLLSGSLKINPFYALHVADTLDKVPSLLILILILIVILTLLLLTILPFTFLTSSIHLFDLFPFPSFYFTFILRPQLLFLLSNFSHKSSPSIFFHIISFPSFSAPTIAPSNSVSACHLMFPFPLSSLLFSSPVLSSPPLSSSLLSSPVLISSLLTSPLTLHHHITSRHRICTSLFVSPLPLTLTSSSMHYRHCV